MNERVVYNNMLLIGVVIAGFGVFLLLILPLTYIHNTSYPQEIYTVLQSHNYILPDIYYFYLSIIAICLILIGLAIA